MKNVSFTVEKNGAFVNSRVRAMHHSSENRMGLMEVGVAFFFVAVLVGFALMIVR